MLDFCRIKCSLFLPSILSLSYHSLMNQQLRCRPVFCPVACFATFKTSSRFFFPLHLWRRVDCFQEMPCALLGKKKKKKSSKEDHGGADHEHGAEAICKTGSPPPTETSPKQFALKILTNQCARESTTEIYLRHFNFPIRY